MILCFITIHDKVSQIDGLVEDCSNSSALAMEFTVLHQAIEMQLIGFADVVIQLMNP